MLEIPESHTLARQLEETLTGKAIRSVVAAQTPHGFAFYHGDPAGYNGLLTGRTVESAVAVAGRAEIIAGDVRVMFHDGANVRYLEPGEAPPKKHQLLITFDDGCSIVCTVSMYAGLYAYRDGEMDDNFYYSVAGEKPSPLSDGFDEAYFDRLLAVEKPGLSAKALLATEQRIPGLGNGALQDILFRAGIHPKAKLGSLNGAKRDALYRSIRQTLREMTDAGGRDTEKDLFGNSGGYHTILSKNTLADPCPQCGGPIVKQAYLGGAVYFCPVCQPL